MTLVVGDRVRHRYAKLTGIVERAADSRTEYAKVRWDHCGLAVAALGSMADLQRPSMLEKVEDGE